MRSPAPGAPGTDSGHLLECVVNISEGRNASVLDELANACGDDLLDLHRDPHHNRSVFTLVGEQAPRSLAAMAVERLDLRTHEGVHPRLGVVDVVPFVALDGDESAARSARDGFARWADDALALPFFLYGGERSLPDVRRHAFSGLTPDTGPATPHPSAGACAVGARGLLVAYNVWLPGGDLTIAQDVAREVRGTAVRALGLAVGQRVQVSLNLVTPDEVGPAEAFDRVRELATSRGSRVEGAELVGLVPAQVLNAIPRARWEELDLSDDRTIEARLARRQQGRENG